MDFFNQISFGPNIFLTKTTSMSTTTTTIKMGFDTIEINLVYIKHGQIKCFFTFPVLESGLRVIYNYNSDIF